MEPPMPPPTLENMPSTASTTATYCAAGEGDEDLAQHDEAHADVGGVAEMDHQADAEHGDGHAEVQRDPFEAAGPAD
ncbi:hypothetical protein OPT61_g7546 [Boeremia exigua]|uniref:Uncharacterized protein n=1 Tax=Boeremia exigua TaxID=749465 RepID=A0ACC2I238_9PLEO|nr:hypothetical protein OPT61_g7546 [Boeremia exigua]